MQQSDHYDEPVPRGARPISRPALGAALRWPFASRLASPLWLGVRLYLGWFWLRMGIAKIQGGWLTENPMEAMFRAIAEGYTAVPIPAYRVLVRLLLEMGLAPVVSVTFPLIEVAIGVALLGGVLVVPVAAAAILMNVNLILSGIATLGFDGRFIVLQALLILAWRVSGHLGVQRILVRGFAAGTAAVRGAPRRASGAPSAARRGGLGDCPDPAGSPI